MPFQSSNWPKFFLLFLASLLIQVLPAQEIAPSFQLLKSLPLKTEKITSDKLQQFYTIDSTNLLIKYDLNGNELFRYSNNTLGELVTVDARDPFNLLLFYPDYQLAIILDRTLNPKAEYNFLEAGFYEVSAVATADDNNIWLYDATSFQLKKLGPQGRLIVESSDLSLLLGDAPAVSQIISRQNGVFLMIPDKGVLVFNAFGQYQKTIVLKALEQFQCLGENLVCRAGTEMFVIFPESGIINKLSLPEGFLFGNEDVQIQKDRLFIRKKDKIEIYSY